MGWTIAVVGWLIVFAALLLLSVIFTSLPRLLNIQRRRKLRKEGKDECATGCEDLSADVNAAIATALSLYFNELHDEESNVITIKKVSKTYSPWSSKIYGVRNFPG